MGVSLKCWVSPTKPIGFPTKKRPFLGCGDGGENPPFKVFHPIWKPPQAKPMIFTTTPKNTTSWFRPQEVASSKEVSEGFGVALGASVGETTRSMEVRFKKCSLLHSPTLTLTSQWNPEIKVELYFLHTKYVIPKSLKLSHWPSKNMTMENPPWMKMHLMYFLLQKGIFQWHFVTLPFISNMFALENTPKVNWYSNYHFFRCYVSFRECTSKEKAKYRKSVTSSRTYRKGRWSNLNGPTKEILNSRVLFWWCKVCVKMVMW